MPPALFTSSTVGKIFRATYGFARAQKIDLHGYRLISIRCADIPLNGAKTFSFASVPPISPPAYGMPGMPRCRLSTPQPSAPVQKCA